MPKRYRKLRGDTAYYPFAARTGLRARQRRHARALRIAGAAALILAAVLALTAQEGAIVRVNGSDCGVRICPPYRYAISGSLHTGENLLEIEVNTTLGRRMNDFLGQYMPTEPQGLKSEVTIQLF